MKIVRFQVPRGIKAMLKRDGFLLVKFKREEKYRLRKKRKTLNVENNQQFRKRILQASKDYKCLTNKEREGLEKRMLQDKFYKNVWHQYLSEYFNSD